MAAQEELLLLLKLKDEASKQLGAIRTNLQGLNSTMSSVGNTFLSLGKYAVLGFAGVAAAAGTMVAVTGVKFAAMKEQSQIAFTTMLKDGKLAQSFLKELELFAARTPFEFADLTRATQRMMAMGIAAKDVMPTLSSIGDAVAGMGGGSEMIDAITRALGQMSAKGMTAGQEMMQLTEQGIPAWKYLADAIGVSIPEAMKLVEQRAVSAQTTIKAVTDGMNKDFGGMMEKQSTTFNGLVSTIKDTFAILSSTVMAPFFTRITEGLKKFAEAMSNPVYQEKAKEIANALASGLDTVIAWIARSIDWFRQHREQIADFAIRSATVIATFVRGFVAGMQQMIAMKAPVIAAMTLIGASIVFALGPAGVAYIAIVGFIALLGAMKLDWEKSFGSMPVSMKQSLRDMLAGMGEWSRSLAGIVNVGISIFNGLANAANFTAKAMAGALGGMAAQRGDMKAAEEWFDRAKNMPGYSKLEYVDLDWVEGAIAGLDKSINESKLDAYIEEQNKKIQGGTYVRGSGGRVIPPPDSSGFLTGDALQKALAGVGGGSAGSGGGAGADGGGGGGKSKADALSAENIKFIDDVISRLPQLSNSIKNLVPPEVVDEYVKARDDVNKGIISLTDNQKQMLNAVIEFDAAEKKFTEIKTSLNLQIAEVGLAMADLDARGQENSTEFKNLSERMDALKDASSRIDMIKDMGLDRFKQAIDLTRESIDAAIKKEAELAKQRAAERADLLRQFASIYSGSKNMNATMLMVNAALNNPGQSFASADFAGGWGVVRQTVDANGNVTSNEYGATAPKLLANGDANPAYGTGPVTITVNVDASGSSDPSATGAATAAAIVKAVSSASQQQGE